MYRVFGDVTHPAVGGPPHLLNIYQGFALQRVVQWFSNDLSASLQHIPRQLIDHIRFFVAQIQVFEEHGVKAHFTPR